MNFKEYLNLHNYKNHLYISLVAKTIEAIGGDFSKLDNFLLNIKNTKSAETFNSYLKALKVYKKFSGKNFKLPNFVRPDITEPPSISEENFLEMVNQIDGYVFKKPLKVRALLMFMFYTGVRAEEVVSLQRRNINLDKRIVKIYSHKVGRERLVPFPEKVKQILVKYFKSDEELINAFNVKRQTLNYICKVIKEQLNFKIYPHLLRHSFATNLIKKGIDVSYVSKLLGHRNVQTTMRYLDFNIDIIKEIYDKKIK